MIHPSAIIDPKAELGSDVSVGACAVIEAGARIGDRCTIQAHAVIGGYVEMGEENLIGHGAVIGGDPQDLAFKPEVRSKVRIGRGNKLREYVTVHRGTAEGSETVVGDNCYLMAGAHLAHNVQVGSHTIIANNCLLGGYVQIGERAFLGGGCVFHQYVHVGRLVICQGISGYSKDIPPFVTGTGRNQVAGLNAIGLRRAGFTAAERAEVKQAFDLLFRSGLNVSQALAAAQERVWGPRAEEFWRFVAASTKRGIVAPLRKSRHSSSGEE